MLLAAFIAVGLVGATVSAWGPPLGLDRLGRWFSDYRSLQRLYPLWFALYRANPGIALHPPASRLADLRNTRRVHFRLYRRVVEIRDGWLLLRPHMDARATTYARRLAASAGLPDADARAVVDAAALAVALRAPSLHRREPSHARGEAITEPADLQGEVETLERVARCYRRSPIVRAVATRSAAEAAGRRLAYRGKP